MTIYLASVSPRRRRLLRQIGVDFQLLAPKYSEKFDEGLEPEEYARKNAIQKVESVLNEVAEG